MSVDLQVAHEWRKTARGTVHIERATLDNLEQSGNTDLPNWYELWSALPVCGGEILVEVKFPPHTRNVHNLAANILRNTGFGVFMFGCWEVEGDTIPNEEIKNA